MLCKNTVTIPQLAFLMQKSIRSPLIKSHSSVGEIYTVPKNNGRSGAESMTEAHRASFLFLRAQRSEKNGWLVNYLESIYANMLKDHIIFLLNLMYYILKQMFRTEKL